MHRVVLWIWIFFAFCVSWNDIRYSGLPPEVTIFLVKPLAGTQAPKDAEESQLEGNGIFNYKKWDFGWFQVKVPLARWNWEGPPWNNSIWLAFSFSIDFSPNCKCRKAAQSHPVPSQAHLDGWTRGCESLGEGELHGEIVCAWNKMEIGEYLLLLQRVFLKQNSRQFSKQVHNRTLCS